MTHADFTPPDAEKCFEARDAVIDSWSHVEEWVILSVGQADRPDFEQIKSVTYPHILSAADFTQHFVPQAPEVTMGDALEAYSLLEGIHTGGLARIGEENGISPAAFLLTTDLRGELSEEDARLLRRRAMVIGVIVAYYSNKVRTHIDKFFEKTV